MGCSCNNYMITGLYIAVFALVQVVMIVWIARTRIRERISLGTGDSDVLECKSRVYGNFTEVVPPAILLMVIAELSGAPLWIIHWMGVLMIISRISHAIGLIKPPGYGPFRMAGVLITLAVFLIGALICISLAWPRL